MSDSENRFEEFVFSQSALQDYEDCHRRFELRYLLDVRWPAQETAQALQYETGQQKGQEFHHLAHQHALGIPAEALAATIQDTELRTWWERYVAWQAKHLPVYRYPELTLTAPIGEAQLMAKYDVVAKLPDGTFLIVDWKTGRPQTAARLANRIHFVYWFAENGETVEYSLSAEKLQQDETRLASLINDITASVEFPKTADERRCRFCAYRSLCERGETPGDLNELEDHEMLGGISLDLDEIEEISF
jgi:hypothetical protein